MVSVIVPIYNARDYLERCISSICNQTFVDLEIILVDDGSIDGSGEICDDFSQKDKRISVIHQENKGIVNARKVGLKASHGEFIGFVDSDDWIELNMYERLFQTMIEQEVDIVMCGRFENTGEIERSVFHGVPEGKYTKEQMIHSVYPRMIVNNAFFEWGIFPSLWDKLFKKECVETFQLRVDDRIEIGEDAACVYPCCIHANSIYIMRECLYHYRQTIGSMVKRIEDFELEREKFHILYQFMKTELSCHHDRYDLQEQWDKYILFLMTSRADSLYNGYDKLDYLFPFPRVKKGDKIILYGAGTYGQRLFKYIKKTDFCKIVAWVDQNYIELQKMNLNVEDPTCITGLDFDHILVAITYEKPRNSLYKDLLKKIDETKIELIDVGKICNEESKRAFGLL